MITVFSRYNKLIHFKHKAIIRFVFSSIILIYVQRWKEKIILMKNTLIQTCKGDLSWWASNKLRNSEITPDKSSSACKALVTNVSTVTSFCRRSCTFSVPDLKSESARMDSEDGTDS